MKWGGSGQPRGTGQNLKSHFFSIILFYVLLKYSRINSYGVI